jgi:hypothetical protein
VTAELAEGHGLTRLQLGRDAVEKVGAAIAVGALVVVVDRARP